MAKLAKSERAALCDLMEKLGPDAPTLCEGWTTLDLAAHLVVRERRPDSGPGLLVPALSFWTEHVRVAAKKRGFKQLVDQVRAGSPVLSRLPFVDEAINGMEYFIHHEDVRRAQAGWEPRQLDVETQELLWKRATTIARMGKRNMPVGFVLMRTMGASAVIKLSEPSVKVQGPASEILMFVSGRKAAARVELEGDADAIAQLESAKLGL